MEMPVYGQLPEPVSGERGKLNTDIMGMPGDPFADMAKSLRNIEYTLLAILAELTKKTEVANESTEPVEGSKVGVRRPGKTAD